MKKHDPEFQAALDAEIAARREQFRLMTPEQRVAKLREEQEERERKETESLRLDEKKLKEVLEGIGAIGARVRARTESELADHRWQIATLPQLESIGVPGRHRIRLTEWGNEKQEEKFNRVRELCRGTGAVVALVGKRGCGKTTIACQLMRERVESRLAYNRLDVDERPAIEPPEPGRYEKLMRLGAMFKSGFAGFGSISQGRDTELYLAWTRLPLLVIDEIHDAETIAPTMAMLVDLVDRRYAEQRDTILISNRDADSFAKEMNQSVISRLSETGAIISCEWESWRSKR